MARSLELPPSFFQVALEERLLLQALRRFLGEEADTAFPPALTMSARNDIVAFARQRLSASSWPLFLDCVESLPSFMGTEDGEQLPPPMGCVHPEMAEAEELAWHTLNQGTGHLWTSVRATVSALPFEPDPRPHASGASFTLGLYGKRGIVGMSKHTHAFRNTCRLLNRMVYATYPGLRWASLMLGADNTVAPHTDKWNSDADSLLIGLSHYVSGELWIATGRGCSYEEHADKLVAGELFPTSCRAVLFNGRRCLHTTKAWKGGNRVVLIAYTPAHAQTVGPALRTALEELGFMVPMPVARP